MKIKNFSNKLALLLIIGSIACFTTSCKKTSTDEPPTVDEDEPLVEFIDFDGNRIEGDQFDSRKFTVSSNDSLLTIKFNNTGTSIPFTDLMLNYNHGSDWIFEEGNVVPSRTGYAANSGYPQTLGVKAYGYFSGTGKFRAHRDSSYLSSEMYKHEDEWIFEFHEVLVTDIEHSDLQGKLSGLIRWSDVVK